MRSRSDCFCPPRRDRRAGAGMILRPWHGTPMAVGFDSLWVADHLLFPLSNPDQAAPGRWECWSILSRVGPCCHVTYRNSGAGRLPSFPQPRPAGQNGGHGRGNQRRRRTLGLGAGWFETEYEAFGYPFDHRLGRSRNRCRLFTDSTRADDSTSQGHFIRFETLNCVRVGHARMVRPS